MDLQLIKYYFIFIIVFRQINWLAEVGGEGDARAGLFLMYTSNPSFDCNNEVFSVEFHSA